MVRGFSTSAPFGYETPPLVVGADSVLRYALGRVYAVSLAVGQWEYARRTAQSYDPHISGVVSTQPSFLAGMSFDAEDAADPAIAQQRDEAQARGDDKEAIRARPWHRARRAVP